MTARFASSGSDGNVDLGNRAYGFEYVGSNYDVGVGMWDSMTAYIAGRTLTAADTDSFSAHERQYLASTGNWTNAYSDMNSNSADWVAA
jgi:hypothetical protein